MTDVKDQPKVIVFSAPTCSFCNAAKKYFREKGVNLRERRVAVRTKGEAGAFDLQINAADRSPRDGFVNKAATRSEIGVERGGRLA